MKRFLCFILPFLLIISAVYALEGGLYNVTSSGSALQGGDATSENYSASTSLTDLPGHYNATGNGFAANIGMFPVTGLVARPTATNTSNSTNTTNATTTRSSSSGGGGGGGGSLWPKNITKNEPAPVGVVELSDARTWSNVKEGGTVSYETSHNLSIKSITLHFTKLTETVRLEVRQYKGRPSDTPELNHTYKYLSIEHRGLEDTDIRLVDFEVPRSWLESQGLQPEDIALYRLESGKWVSYGGTLKRAGASSVLYEAFVPGFSYFAVAPAPGKGPQQAVNSTVPLPQPVENSTAPAAQQPQEQTPADPTPEQPSPVIIERKAQKSSGGSQMWLFAGIGIGVLVLGLVGVQMYQKRKAAHTGIAVQQPAAHSMQPSVQQAVSAGQQGAVPKELLPEHDPAAAVHNYIKGMRARGASDEEIKQKLLSVGWDSLVVDMELMRK